MKNERLPAENSYNQVEELNKDILKIQKEAK